MTHVEGVGTGGKILENESVQQSEEEKVWGTCCFCQDDCNPLAQSCGACMRAPHSHTKVVDEELEEDNSVGEEEEWGTCCFCQDDCNPLAQLCGACMRAPHLYEKNAMSPLLYSNSLKVPPFKKRKIVF